ncbi:MAG: hypothetical protein M1828_002701 [Chrysothrix sp. TS-e1954]|nr:MAG: hypothetical protein M1828_002701 [Chrysothrix sp. TS-e1954]
MSTNVNAGLPFDEFRLEEPLRRVRDGVTKGLACAYLRVHPDEFATLQSYGRQILSARSIRGEEWRAIREIDREQMVQEMLTRDANADTRHLGGERWDAPARATLSSHGKPWVECRRHAILSIFYTILKYDRRANAYHEARDGASNARAHPGVADASSDASMRSRTTLRTSSESRPAKRRRTSSQAPPRPTSAPLRNAIHEPVPIREVLFKVQRLDSGVYDVFNVLSLLRADAPSNLKDVVPEMHIEYGRFVKRLEWALDFRPTAEEVRFTIRGLDRVIPPGVEGVPENDFLMSVMCRLIELNSGIFLEYLIARRDIETDEDYGDEDDCDEDDCDEDDCDEDDCDEDDCDEDDCDDGDRAASAHHSEPRDRTIQKFRPWER